MHRGTGARAPTAQGGVGALGGTTVKCLLMLLHFILITLMTKGQSKQIFLKPIKRINRFLKTLLKFSQIIYKYSQIEETFIKKFLTFFKTCL